MENSAKLEFDTIKTYNLPLENDESINWIHVKFGPIKHDPEDDGLVSVYALLEHQKSLYKYCSTDAMYMAWRDEEGKLKVYMFAQPDETHEFLKQMRLHLQETEEICERVKSIMLEEE